MESSVGAGGVYHPLPGRTADNKKDSTSWSLLSGHPDLNRGPLRPERSALAGLSHAPREQQAGLYPCPPELTRNPISTAPLQILIKNCSKNCAKPRFFCIKPTLFPRNNSASLLHFQPQDCMKHAKTPRIVHEIPFTGLSAPNFVVCSSLYWPDKGSRGGFSLQNRYPSLV